MIAIELLNETTDPSYIDWDRLLKGSRSELLLMKNLHGSSDEENLQILKDFFISMMKRQQVVTTLYRDIQGNQCALHIGERSSPADLKGDRYTHQYGLLTDIKLNGRMTRSWLFSEVLDDIESDFLKSKGFTRCCTITVKGSQGEAVWLEWKKNSAHKYYKNFEAVEKQVGAETVIELYYDII